MPMDSAYDFSFTFRFIYQKENREFYFLSKFSSKSVQSES